MSIWWSLHLRREAASVPLARRLLLGTMESAGVDPDVSYDLSVALTEACANAVEHGHRDRPTGTIVLRATALPHQVRLCVADGGSWKDPQPQAPGPERRGRGIAMMRAAMEEVVITPGPTGTTVEMRARIAT